MKEIILVTGNDEAAIRRAVGDIARGLGSERPDNLAFEIVRADRENLDPLEAVKSVLTALDTPSFFCPTRTVWLKHFNYLVGAKTDSAAAKRADEALETLLTGTRDNNDENLTLLMDIPGLDRRKAFYKECDKRGKVHYFRKVDIQDKDYANNIREKIRTLSRERQLNLEPAAVEFLAETMGSDTGRLESELEKLACYVDENRPISVRDCREIGASSPETVAWAFADALSAGDTKRAFSELDILLDQARQEKGGSNPEMGMLYGVIRKFQDLMGFKAAAAALGVQGNLSFAAFQSALASAPEPARTEWAEHVIHTWNPYRSYMVYKQSTAWSERALVNALSAILDANTRLVSGASSPRVLLETLVVKICSEAAARRRAA